jgi:hypothetical protein
MTGLSLPMVLLGVVLATLYGALFHLFCGGRIIRMLLYILLSWIGFWIGQALADLTGWTFLSIGSLHVGLATLGSFVFIGLGYWLSLVDNQRK